VVTASKKNFSTTARQDCAKVVQNLSGLTDESVSIEESSPNRTHGPIGLTNATRSAIALKPARPYRLSAGWFRRSTAQVSSSVAGPRAALAIANPSNLDAMPRLGQGRRDQRPAQARADDQDVIRLGVCHVHRSTGRNAPSRLRPPMGSVYQMPRAVSHVGLRPVRTTTLGWAARCTSLKRQRGNLWGHAPLRVLPRWRFRLAFCFGNFLKRHRTPCAVTNERCRVGRPRVVRKRPCYHLGRNRRQPTWRRKLTGITTGPTERRARNRKGSLRRPP